MEWFNKTQEHPARGAHGGGREHQQHKERVEGQLAVEALADAELTRWTVH
jgi:hypothetical protein